MMKSIVDKIKEWDKKREKVIEVLVKLKFDPLTQ